MEIIRLDTCCHKKGLHRVDNWEMSEANITQLGFSSSREIDEN
jgi:hypothetical protein